MLPVIFFLLWEKTFSFKIIDYFSILQYVIFFERYGLLTIQFFFLNQPTWELCTF